MGEQLLSGIRIVDLTTVVVGPAEGRRHQGGVILCAFTCALPRLRHECKTMAASRSIHRKKNGVPLSLAVVPSRGGRA
jgi:hypothetical protein